MFPVSHLFSNYRVQQEEKRLKTKEELEDGRLSRHKLEQ